MMIYLVWYYHHNLFQMAEVISLRMFFINGLWILFLTFVPFTTAWVGAFPHDTVPEFLYALNLFVWSGVFHWMDYQVRRDNPGTARDASTGFADCAILYGAYGLCMVLAFIRPILSMYIIGISTIIMLARLFTAD